VTRAGWAAVIVVVLLSALAQAGGLVPLLRYDRLAIANGELWRLISGHLVHLGPSHLVLNAIGLVLVAALVGPRMHLAGWGFAFVLSSLVISAGLWLHTPQLQWYVGLSGVLHGLLVAGAVNGLTERSERWFSLTLLMLLTAKIGWEQVLGPMPGTAAAAGGPVVVDAHLFGALGGLAATVLVVGWTRLRPGAARSGADETTTPDR